MLVDNLRIGSRLLLIIAGALGGMAAIGALALIALDTTLMQDRRDKTQHLVQSAHSLVAHFAGLAADGTMAEADAQAAALAALESLRYDGEEYFFVLDDAGTMLMHPIKPELNGDNVRNAEDPNGFRLFAEMLRIAAEPEGAGFVAYLWPKPGFEEPQPKVSYVMAFRDWDWVIGSGIYVDDVAAAFWDQVEIVGSVGLLVLVLVGGAALLIGRSISRPIIELAGRMDRLAGGDTGIEVPYAHNRSEVGELARSLQVFKDNAARMEEMHGERAAAEARAAEERRTALMDMADRLEAGVASVVASVGKGCADLRSTSDALGTLADKADGQARTAAQGSQEASVNVQTVASATEELTGSIGEISQQVAHSADIARRAVAGVDGTNERVQALTGAAEKIGQIVQLINAIAEQTNLLALNATIEAARAGEAGKGFAVVASEVKNLAKQTARATEDIAGQVQAMQGATGDTAAAIAEIGGVIRQIDEIAAAIAAAVEEQGSATQEIARNVEQAAQGTQTVAVNIAGVSKASEETGQVAGQVHAIAGRLGEESERLRQEIDGFLAQIRAG